ncbi:hypothetical protein [Pseudomonas aeruginosa]|uniref:hypothetical protein n=1 Tax=Pseudomonas aeruginosa TaxID=287 RepID=UPI0005BE32E9|nr:hypothetical protein [Pseudomonas aeruginosa]
MADAWKITGSRTWCDKVVELEEHADRSIRSRDDGSFKVPLYAVPASHVVVPRELLERVEAQLDLRAEFDPTYPHETQPVNDDARLYLELRALVSEQA